MDETSLQALRVAGFVAAAIFALVAQRLFPHAGLRESWRVNGGLWLINAGVVGAVCGACACILSAWATRNGFGILNQSPVSPWAAVPITIVVLDLVSYGWHRANHRVPLLWRLHQVHHSDPHFTVSTGVRFHPGELLLSLPIRVAAVVAIGAPVVAVLLFEILFTVANLFEHGDIRLPLRTETRLGRVGVTPALHRRHHTKVGAARDTNFGTIFSVWDRMFGTFTASDSATRVETGLPGMEDLRLFGALQLPLRRVPRWVDGPLGSRGGGW